MYISNVLEYIIFCPHCQFIGDICCTNISSQDNARSNCFMCGILPRKLQRVYNDYYISLKIETTIVYIRNQYNCRAMEEQVPE